VRRKFKKITSKDVKYASFVRTQPFFSLVFDFFSLFHPGVKHFHPGVKLPLTALSKLKGAGSSVFKDAPSLSTKAVSARELAAVSLKDGPTLSAIKAISRELAAVFLRTCLGKGAGSSVIKGRSLSQRYQGCLKGAGSSVFYGRSLSQHYQGCLNGAGSSVFKDAPSLSTVKAVSRELTAVFLRTLPLAALSRLSQGSWQQCL
jgi:hypothetical protein